MNEAKSQTFENFPSELRKLAQWVDRREKQPVNPRTGGNAQANNPGTWSDFQTALTTFRSGGYDGIGFELSNNGIVGIDRDHCINPETGEIDPEALKMVERLDSYTEISPSGTGLHIWAYGDIPTDGRNNRKCGIEMYKARHYLTVTGNTFGPVRPLAHREREVAELYAEVFPDKAAPPLPVIVAPSDDSLLEVGLQRDKELIECWNGARKNGNESSDDMALMNKLAYWCNRDVDQMVAAFSRSPHAAQKDEKHLKKAERKDYLIRTAKKAADECQRAAAEDNRDYGRRTAKEDFSVVIGSGESNDGAEAAVAAVLEQSPKTLDDLAPDSLLDALFSMKDEVARQREISKLKAAAKKEGFARDFDALIKAHKEQRKLEQAEKARTTVEYITLKNCPLQGLKKPASWNVTSHGVWRNLEGEVQTACPHPIIITDRLQNVDTQKEKLNIAFYRDRTWKSVPVSRSTAGSRTAIVSLADNGIQVNSENAKYLVPYLEALETANSDVIPRRRSIGRLGWTGSSDFFPYSKGYVFDGEEEFRDVFGAVSENGDFALWVRTVGAARQENALFRTVLAASFAAPLLWPLNKLCFCVHLWGPTGTAKTVALYAAMSVWGEPTRLTQTFNGTKIGLERYAAFCNSIPLAMDERETARYDKYNAFDQIIYELMEGKGSARGKKTGGIQKIDQWRLPVLTTGESPLISENSKAGAKNRVLELYCEEELFSDSPGMANIAKENYGVAGRKWIGYLLQEYKNDKFQGVKDFFQAFYGTLDSEKQHTDKQLASLSIIILADYFSSMRIFGIAPDPALDQAQALGKALLEMMATKAEIDSTDDAWEWTKSWVAQNKVAFLNNFGIERFGEVISNEIVFVIGKVFTTALTEAGFNPRTCQRSFLKKGYLIPSDEKGTMQSRCVINGIQVRGYRLKVANSWNE
jgi:uncharacterized protein (DUF927 family)